MLHCQQCASRKYSSRFIRIDRTLNCAIDTKAILAAWQALPENILRATRNKRQHISPN